MPEATSNVEFAHKIHEDGHHHPTPAGRREQWVEIIEAVVLAIVAVATAWSGYEASKWDALSNEYYNLASSARVGRKRGRRWRARTGFTTSRPSMAGLRRR